MKTIKQLGLLLFISIFFVGCHSVLEKEKENEGEAVKVKVQKLETSSGCIGQSYIGTVHESVSVPLSFLTSGTVKHVYVEEGQPVKNGQLLASLDCETYENSYKIASSKEKQAEDAYSRLEAVYKNGSLPEIKFVEVKTGLEQARAMVSIAEKNLRDCSLYASGSGVIGKRMIEPGMSAIPGNPVFQLVKIENVKISIPVPEREISDFKKGLEADVTVSALGDQLFVGQVSEVGVIANPLSHTYLVKISMANPELVLKPGMVCVVKVKNPELEQRIVIPLGTIQVDSENKKYVYVIGDRKRAEKRIIESGALTGNGVVVKKGLFPGDVLITEGSQKVKNNTLIQIIR